MFERRHKRRWRQHLKETLWPSMGWQRTFLYYRHRISRMPESANALAAGFACGVAVSFVPFLGFHLILALFLAWLVRGSLLAAAIGTLAGNPWSFPFIWMATYETGSFILGAPVATMPELALTLDAFWEIPHKLLLPMTVGGIPLSLLVWPAVYFPVRNIIRRSRKLRQLKIKKALRRKIKRRNMLA